jgi:kynurenine formamidase
MSEYVRRPQPTEQQLADELQSRSNWNRWGADDEVGAPNLITEEKRVRAAGLISTGQVVSLSRPLPTLTKVADHIVPERKRLGDAGVVVDHFGLDYHSSATTHLDALNHVWGAPGMWGGRRADDVIAHTGIPWADVDQWSERLVTRGVMLDVPAFRGEPYVTDDKPVQGWELEAIVEQSGVTLEPGDALVVHSGREAYSREVREWGTPAHSAERPALYPSRGSSGHALERPGLDATCVSFIRDTDCAMLVWDMLEAKPNGYPASTPFTLHAVIWAYGVALVDNALLEPLALALREAGRSEFFLAVPPLRVLGATGSPVNPIAIL